MPRINIDLSDLRQLPVTSEATIPDEYLDSMGHMNVMWYTHLFSMAMRGVFRLIGLSWEDMPHFMVNMDKDDVASTHEMVCAYVDMSRRRMTAIPVEVIQQLDAMIADHRQLDWPAPTCGIMAP